MKAQKFVMGTSLGVALFGALLAVLFVVPQTTHAHGGVTHSTNAEAIEHLKETARGLLGTRASSTVDISCMAEAIETREDALMTAWDDLGEAISDALADRKEGLMDAWDISNQSDRTKAVREVWKEWKNDKKAAHAEFRSDRKAIWQAFNKTAKTTCKESLPKDESLEKTGSDTVAI
jgi:gas vesicle protein